MFRWDECIIDLGLKLKHSLCYEFKHNVEMVSCRTFMAKK